MVGLLEITGILARLVMLWWDGKFLDRLKQYGISLELYFRYVDDGNMAAWALPPGTRVVDRKLTILQEYIEEDRSIPDGRRTGAILKNLPNDSHGRRRGL